MHHRDRNAHDSLVSAAAMPRRAYHARPRRPLIRVLRAALWIALATPVYALLALLTLREFGFFLSN